jgi:phage terminase large subunit-like protein
MSKRPPLPKGWETWPWEAKQRLLSTLRAAKEDRGRVSFYCPRPVCDGEPHDGWTVRHARTEQRPPAGLWDVWLILAGRGFGKSRTGSEWTWRKAKQIPYGVIVGPTAGDVRDTMVEGESGIIACAPALFKPKYEPSKRRLTWPNGHITSTFSAEEPDRIRGPNTGYAWGDEWAMWRHITEATDNLELTLRLQGDFGDPQMLLTTTPKPRKAVRERIREEGTVVTRGSTYDNVANLADAFARKIIRKYEGTSVGAQELHAELLDDVMGALWNGEMLVRSRRALSALEVAEVLPAVVVAIDPAVTANDGSDETGIVVVGRTASNHCPACGPIADGPHGWVLEDLSGKFSPNGWASIALRAYDRFDADAIIGEVNNGGDLVENTVRTLRREANFRQVRASRGKQTRAEPWAALYEQGRVHTVMGLELLEEQKRTWVPGEEGEESPDRVDAEVWGGTDLMLGEQAGGFAAAG